MRFPSWAMTDDKMKVKYLLSVAALEVGPNGDLVGLSLASGVSYHTLLWSMKNNVSPKIAEQICDSVKNTGIRPYWLTNPGWIRLDAETGDILE